MQGSKPLSGCTGGGLEYILHLYIGTLEGRGDRPYGFLQLILKQEKRKGKVEEDGGREGRVMQR